MMQQMFVTEDVFNDLNEIRRSLGDDATFSDAIKYLMEMYGQVADYGLLPL